jgi:hypothetical protein
MVTGDIRWQKERKKAENSEERKINKIAMFARTSGSY